MFDRVKIFGIEIDRLTMNQAVSRLLSWIDNQEYRCQYVVTPNVDHIVKLQNNEDFRTVYKHAEMVVVDGKPVLLASRLLNKSLPETVPGSDLCPALFEAARTKKKLRVFLLPYSFT